MCGRMWQVCRAEAVSLILAFVYFSGLRYDRVHVLFNDFPERTGPSVISPKSKAHDSVRWA